MRTVRTLVWVGNTKVKNRMYVTVCYIVLRIELSNLLEPASCVLTLKYYTGVYTEWAKLNRTVLHFSKYIEKYQ